MPTNYSPANTFHPGPITIPVDGDARTMTTLAPPIEAALDNANWNYQRAKNGYTVVALASSGTDDGGNNGSSPYTDWFTWTDNPTPNYSNVFDLSLGNPTLQAGDIVTVTARGLLKYLTAAAAGEEYFVQLAWLENGAGTYATVPGSRQASESLASGVNYFPFAISATRTVVTGGPYRTKLNAYMINGSRGVHLLGPYSATLIAYRANGT